MPQRAKKNGVIVFFDPPDVLARLSTSTFPIVKSDAITAPTVHPPLVTANQGGANQDTIVAAAASVDYEDRVDTVHCDVLHAATAARHPQSAPK